MTDAPHDRRLVDVLARPEHVEQLFLGHEPIAVLDQMPQYIENLGLQDDRRAGTTERVRERVELEFAKSVTNHAGNLSGAPSARNSPVQDAAAGA